MKDSHRLFDIKKHRLVAVDVPQHGIDADCILIHLSAVCGDNGATHIVRIQILPQTQSVFVNTVIVGGGTPEVDTRSLEEHLLVVETQ